MKKSGTPTKYPGVSKLGTKTYRVRGKYTDPRTGKQREVDRIIQEVSLRQAVRRRAELLEEARNQADESGGRVRVGEYAKSWIASKALKIDPGSARTYADALELHILPAFGEYFYDALTARDVQAWVDRSLSGEYVTRKSATHKRYSRNTVHGWYRVLRTMTRDAMQDLQLERDPTMRISFPPAPERLVPNALTPEKLLDFLSAVRRLYPQYYALVATLAYTGLRFCHVSAFRWEDWDVEAGTLSIVRKHTSGRLGPVSRKKRAPRVIAVVEPLAAVWREHRARLEANDAPGLADGWMFPNRVGKLHTPCALQRTFERSLAEAGIERHVTVHGMRYTFTDLTRLANIDPVVRRALVGHTTRHMQHHYSTVALDEKRAAAEGVLAVAPLPTRSAPASKHRAMSRSGRAQPSGKVCPHCGARGGDARAFDVEGSL